jgi:alpha-methylacyl-CoA racemase
MALTGVKVLEFSGLAPVPFCGMILADFGAEVIRVDRVGGETSASGNDLLARGKKSISLDLKRSDHIELIKSIIAKFDVLLEPFRPNVMEKLGLGPDVLLKINPKLIYARLTGYGQSEGFYKFKAGHDINYLSVSGALAAFKRNEERPMFPGNVLGDFAAGSLSCAFGIVSALFARSRTGKGQVVDASIVEGTVYLSTFLVNASKTPLWDQPAGRNFLDSGAPNYEVYETLDGKYMAVGSLEPQFYAALLKGLSLESDPRCSLVMDQNQWPVLKRLFAETFRTQTREQWTQIFSKLDACVTPVLDFTEIDSKHKTPTGPPPAPHLSHTPAKASDHTISHSGEHTHEVLASLGVSTADISKIVAPRAKM